MQVYDSKNSFGEEGMQLVQSSNFFSVTIFRTCSIDSVGMCACELGLLLFLKNFELLWELYALFSEGVYKPLILCNKPVYVTITNAPCIPTLS